MSEVLNTSVDYILSGRKQQSTAVADVEDADWVNLPWFDLDRLTEDAKGPVVETIPFRKDWLNRRILRSTGLWITELPSDYDAVDLSEGDAVICSDISIRDLSENWICIFKGIGKPFVARYSSRPVADATINEIIISHTELASGEMHPVARVHARILAKL